MALLLRSHRKRRAKVKRLGERIFPEGCYAFFRSWVVWKVKSWILEKASRSTTYLWPSCLKWPCGMHQKVVPIQNFLVGPTFSFLFPISCQYIFERLFTALKKLWQRVVLCGTLTLQKPLLRKRWRPKEARGGGEDKILFWGASLFALKIFGRTPAPLFFCRDLFDWGEFFSRGTLSSLLGYRKL